MKQGQVTLFAIMGIALVVVFMLSTVYFSDLKDFFSRVRRESFISYDYNEGIVRNSLGFCIDKIYEDAVYLVGNNAGYLNVTPNPKYNEPGTSNWAYFYGEQVPVLLDSSGLHALAGDSISVRVCNKVYVDLGACFDYQSFVEDGFRVSNPSSPGFDTIGAACKMTWKNESLFLKISYPVSLSKGSFSLNTSEFSSELRIPLKKIYASAIEFMNAVRYGSVDGEYNLSQNCNFGQVPQILNNGELEVPKVVQFTDSSRNGFPDFVFRFAIVGYNFTGNC